VKQFLLPAPPDPDGLVRITGADFHYLAHVRRLKKGDRFSVLFPQEKGMSLAEVHAVDDAALTLKLVEKIPAHGAFLPGIFLPPILLFQALPKGSKMDLIVRQAAEGGICEVVPFEAERSIPRRGELRPGGEKLRRWERIIREALQQSGSPVLTALHQPLDRAGLLAYWGELRGAHPGALALLLHQDEVTDGAVGDPAGPLAQPSLHGYLSSIPEILALAVGPEGGFSPAEAAEFIAAGFKPLKFGDTVLRTETAALYGAAAARTILLESESWTQKSR
jgi:16S rRNA (uracil1498-N3)-methyltransferase